MQRFLFGSLLLAGLTPPLQAQESMVLPEMVVTATRSDIPKNQLSAATTVFTREDIEQLQVTTLPDLLYRAAGIDLTQNGGAGKVSSVFMRGTNSNDVLVLIDGVKVGSVTLGTTPFETLPMSQIERVEIIRGPQSSLYGSEAVGGVIQIFTRKGKRDQKANVSFDAGGGSYNTVKSSGTVSGAWGNNWYTVGASHYNTRGFNPQQGNFPNRGQYYNTGVNARLGHHFDNEAEVEAFFMRSAGRSDSDGYFHKLLFVNQVAGIQGSMDFTDHWHSTLRLGQSLDNNFNYALDPTFNSRFDSTRWNVSWVNKLQLSDNHKLVFGTDYRLDQVSSTTTFTRNSRYDVGFFGEMHSRFFENLFLNGSLRVDKNQAFGHYVTGKIGSRYNWESGISAFANFGNAFRAPTFNDLYYLDPFGSHGNPHLSPEQSRSFEAGVAGDHQWGQWEIRAYHTDIDNLITWVTDPITFISMPTQTKKALIEGIEMQISKKIFDWNHKINFQILSPRDKTTHQRLLSRADQVFNYDVSRSFDRFDLGGNLRVRGNSFAQGTGNTRIEVPGFALINLRASYRLGKNWSVKAQLNNLLNKRYQLVNTYNTAGRNFFFTIRYTI